MRLQIRNLTKVYSDGKVALDDFNLELESGVFGLLGPNGAGKSTFLEILALNLMPSSGTVLWRGRDIHRRPTEFRRALGYLPQTFGFYPELTGRQVMRYMGNLHGMGGRRLERRIDECLDRLNLRGADRVKTKGLSGGTRQRLAIAQSLIGDPKLLVIDEPTTGLDPGERVSFRNMLFDLGRDRIVILSTHIVKDVEFACRQMALLFGGRRGFLGPPDEFMRGVEGRVFESEIPIADLERVSAERNVVAIQERAERVVVRWIAPEAGAPQGAEPATANLEDAYVDFIRRAQRETALAAA